MHGASVCCDASVLKHLANGKDVFWAFVDLEKTDDTVDRHGMWQCI